MQVSWSMAVPLLVNPDQRAFQTVWHYLDQEPPLSLAETGHPKRNKQTASRSSRHGWSPTVRANGVR
jgi:hypothetical protein